MVRRLILAATSAGPAMLVRPVDILEFFGRSKSAKLRKQEGSRHSIQTLLRFGIGKGMLTVSPGTYYRVHLRLYFNLNNPSTFNFKKFL